MHIRAVLAHNLRQLRRDRGLSQEELALRAGIDRTYVSSLERGIYSATIDMVGKLAQELGVRPAELLREPTNNT
ncbi:XRE family transcriptional regulator [Dankookia rubra]|uniref:XRE family transcriptional regulator n=1 Tax=Dankookia rubra TaxID=1442381 RepID=A0A4R5Q7Y3_9PROT|nr:helix-turn-helix transcriptional regulator [Dankookia rubra]TDH58207.1 XRE family transcriptional regulator [Dankookia rubra]